MKPVFLRVVILNTPSKVRISKIANAAENAFADRALLLDDNQLLFEQNYKKTKRNTTRSTIIGTAQVLSYEDLVEMELQRNIQVAKQEAKQGRRQSKRNYTIPTQILGKRSHSTELEAAVNQITELGLQEYCSVLSFN